MFSRRPATIPTPDQALPGRDTPTYRVPERHVVLGTPLAGPWRDGLEVLYVGMGCFWGAERVFWQTPGVYSTAVGYAGGSTPHPTYEEVCTGRTGHAEVVQVVYDPAVVSLPALLGIFFEEHDPTQGYRQGNDVGTQYRSAVYTTTDAQLATATAVASAYSDRLRAAGHGAVTTEIAPVGAFYAAEDYHQQYLHKVPNGYCGLAGTGVSCPVGLGVQAATAEQAAPTQ